MGGTPIGSQAKQKINVDVPYIAANVTPSDTVDLPEVARYLRIGNVSGGADLVFMDGEGNTITLQGVAVGEKILCHVTRVLATGTTVSNIVAFY